MKVSYFNDQPLVTDGIIFLEDQREISFVNKIPVECILLYKPCHITG